MVNEARKLKEEIARKRQAQGNQGKGEEMTRSQKVGNLKGKLAQELADKKAGRMAGLRELTETEVKRRRVCKVCLVVFGVILLLLLVLFGIRTFREQQRRRALAAEHQQTITEAGAFLRQIFLNMKTSGLVATKACWDPAITGVTRDIGDSRLKGIENPGDIRVEEGYPGAAEGVYEFTCREDSGEAFLVKVREKNGTFMIIGVE